MTTALTFLIICTSLAAVFFTEAMYLPKRMTPLVNMRERITDPKKRPFCNAFTGCGRKRSNLPALTEQGDELDESINSLMDLSAEPAVENISRQIMYEAKLWEAIQEANQELSRHKSQNSMETSEDDVTVPGRSAIASCALPPCYI